jgi:hypothetical protein
MIMVIRWERATKEGVQGLIVINGSENWGGHVIR